MNTEKMNVFGDKKVVSVLANTRTLGNPNAGKNSNALFEESYKMLKNLFKLKDFLDSTKSKKMDILDLLDEQLDAFDEFLSVYDIQYMELSNAELSAARPEIQRRLKTAVSNIKDIFNIVLKCDEQAILLSKEETDALSDYLYESISHLVTYIYFQFMVNISYADLFNVTDVGDEDEYQGDGENVHVCESIKSYCQVYMEDPVELVTYIHNIYQEYKPRLDILQNDPDMYEAFEAEVGAIIGDLIDLKHCINDDIARGIVQGSYDLQNLIDVIDEKL